MSKHEQTRYTKTELSVSNKKSSSENLLNNLWTDNINHKEVNLRGIVPLPVGYGNMKCPKCNSSNIKGAIILPSADEQDPNIVCIDCQYWWD